MKFNRIFFTVLFGIVLLCVAYANIGIKEMDNLKVWNHASDDLYEQPSFVLQEDIELRYTFNNKDYKRVDTSIITLQQIPYIQKTVVYTVKDEYISGTPDTIYFLEENEGLHYIHNMNGTIVKNELDPYVFFNTESIDIYSLIFNHIPLNMVRNEENKFQYTFDFKLNQYDEKYQSVFNDLINQLTEEFKTKHDVNILDQELNLTITFTEDYQYSTVTLDLTNILEDIIKDTYSGAINNYSLKINYTFSHFDDVKFTEDEFSNVVTDDAPNEYDAVYLFPYFENDINIEGKFEYEEDVDIYELYIPNDVKYEFKVDTDADINFYLLDEQDKIIMFESYEQNESYVLNLKAGYYHLFIESRVEEPTNYKIQTVIKNNVSETVLK